ncbi:MAG: ATP-binding protein [Candidatus Hydrogenedentales bacterium]|jgi:signal transduction histidine kinase
MTPPISHTQHPPDEPLLPLDSNFESFRRQESTLILLNLLIMVGTLVMQLAFKPQLGWPSRTILFLFGSRFLMQTAELLWLSARERPLSRLTQFLYGRASICMHLGFAGLISMVSQNEDAHYTVLLILPVVAAGFRASLPGTIMVASCAGLVSFAEVWSYYQRNPFSSATEYFEAAGTILVFYLVGLVVWLLASQLRQEQVRLRFALGELQRTKDQLVEQEKLAALGELASAIAHEIRNPIAMIASSLAMADKAEGNSSLRTEMFGIALQEARRLEQFTTNFLSYARTKKLRREPTPVGSTLHYLADMAKARASEKSIRIRFRCDDDTVIVVDAFQLHQAMLNLITNALEASSKEAEIEIGCEQSTPNVTVLYVENPGEPIPADIVLRLFDPFFTTKPNGTGLGLAIARKIAEAHGGSLRLARNEGGRVRFTLHLPAADTTGLADT